jgi:hypothetical protein
MAESTSSPLDHPSSGPEDAALVSILLQRHQAALVGRLVLVSLGRLISVGIAIYISTTDRLSTTQLVASGLAAYLVTVVWIFEGRRLSMQLAGLEETLVRRADRGAADLYVESGYYFLSPRQSILSLYEPAAWWIVNASVLIVSGLLNGVWS